MKSWVIMKKSFMADKLKKACKSVGANIVFGARYGAQGQIIFSDLKKRISFVNCCFDINPYGSSLVARNKGFTRAIFEKEGIKMPQGAYFSPEMDKYKNVSRKDLNGHIYHFADKLKYPIVLKGADIHRGECVFIINNQQELAKRLDDVWSKTLHIVVEKYIPITNYRILLFNDKIIACYSKNPFHIVGNGKDSIEVLIKKEKIKLKKLDIVTDLAKLDEEIHPNLKSSGYKFDSILKSKEKLNLIDVANISMGGSLSDDTEFVNEELRNHCKHIMNVMNMKFAGIDMLSKDISKFPKDSYLIEINSSPSLESYSKYGKMQSKVIDELLKNMISQMKDNV